MFDLRENSETLEQIQFLIAEGRFKEAMETLNQIGPYRFTALFRIAGDDLHNLVIYDKQAQGAPLLHSMQLSDSYCVFVKNQKDAFIVSDSENDRRVVDHPKRPVVHSYCGVPIMGMSGQVFGTLCHFDYDPIDDDGSSLEWLKAVSELFNPTRSAEMLARGVQPKVDALEAVSMLLGETSISTDEAIAAFEEYARPVREQLSHLPKDFVDITNLRIEAILERLSRRNER